MEITAKIQNWMQLRLISNRVDRTKQSRVMNTFSSSNYRTNRQTERERENYRQSAIKERRTKTRSNSPSLAYSTNPEHHGTIKVTFHASVIKKNYSRKREGIVIALLREPGERRPQGCKRQKRCKIKTCFSFAWRRHCTRHDTRNASSRSKSKVTIL